MANFEMLPLEMRNKIMRSRAIQMKASGKIPAAQKKNVNLSVNRLKKFYWFGLSLQIALNNLSMWGERNELVHKLWAVAIRTEMHARKLIRHSKNRTISTRIKIDKEQNYRKIINGKPPIYIHVSHMVEKIGQSIQNPTHNTATRVLQKYYAHHFGWTYNSPKFVDYFRHVDVKFFFAKINRRFPKFKSSGPRGAMMGLDVRRKLPPVPKRPIRSFKIPNRAPPKAPSASGFGSGRAIPLIHRHGNNKVIVRVNDATVRVPKGKKNLPRASGYQLGTLAIDARGQKKIVMKKEIKGRGVVKQWFLYKKK